MIYSFTFAYIHINVQPLINNSINSLCYCKLHLAWHCSRGKPAPKDPFVRAVTKAMDATKRKLLLKQGSSYGYDIFFSRGGTKTQGPKAGMEPTVLTLYICKQKAYCCCTVLNNELPRFSHH